MEIGKMYGFGAGLASIGDFLLKWGAQRQDQDWRAKQSAMDRALQEKELVPRAAAQKAQEDYYTGLLDNQKRDDERADMQLHINNYGGSEVDPTKIPARFHGMLDTKDSYVPGTMPADMPIPAGNFETLQSKTTLKEPNTPGMRIANTNATSRTLLAQKRDDFLREKLNSDENFKLMANQTSLQRLKAQIDMAGDRIGAMLDVADQRTGDMVWRATAEAAYQQWRVENGGDRSDPFAIIDRLTGGKPGAPAAPKTTPPPVPVPAPPPGRRGPRPGSAPPPAAGDPLADLERFRPKPKP